MKRALTTLHGEIEAVTDLAVLWRPDDCEPAWIPRSQILDGDSVDVGDTEIECASWFARKEGWI